MRRLLMAWFLAMLLALPCHAAEQMPTSVRELIIIGLEKNIGFQIEKLNIPIASTVVESNVARFDPELFAFAGYSEMTTPIASTLSLLESSESNALSAQAGLRKKFKSGLLAELAINTDWLENNDTTNALDPSYRSGLEINLTQPLFRDFGEKTNTSTLRIARNQRNQADLQHQLQAQTLALQIELLATQYAGQKEIVDLRTEAVALAEELYTANKRRFDTGVIPVSEVQEAETALANRELNLSLALQSKELNFENLNRLLNHSLTQRLGEQQLYSFATDQVAADLPEFGQLFNAAQDKNLNLQLAAIDTLNAEIQQDFYQNQLKPQLDLNLQAGLNGLSGDERDPSTPTRYAGAWGDSLSGAAEADGYYWSAGMQFSVPLGNRLAKANLQQANLLHRQSTYQQQDLKTELRSQLQQQVTNLQRAVEQVKIAARFEKLAKLSLHQEQRRQQEGLSDTFRVISFQDNMINAEIGRINALVQYYASLAQLNFTRGINLEQYNIVLSQQVEENSREIM